ncbi:flagellar basal body P-ring protein FlgI [Opitutales bacterium ASA1]|uniref:flagellar basal body P-ring protein FlgI n=1 Tax=Congregicoccus parvus TaxID=3081749 RepID=UPI002B2ED8CE|nr:flagellar basal body P-ring protein FlgI [Opitutales bacterium ASA1]
MQGRILVSLLLAAVALASTATAARIKDLVLVEGGRDNQLVGYGLVIGLSGDGDSSTSFYTVQSIANALQRFGINVAPSLVKSKNVAAVMITADIPAFLKPGQRIDVTVSSVGDAKSLQGGVLLQTPLVGGDDQVYAVAQGPVAVGGFLGGEGGEGGATVQKNHPTVGMIAGGAIVERAIPMQIVADGEMRLLLLNPDFSSAARMAEAINVAYPDSALAADSSTVRVRVPEVFDGREVDFIAALGRIDVVPDIPARIIINERTGTIVATSSVRISTVAVSHGALTITISSSLAASQPGAFSPGQTTVLPSTNTEVTEVQGGFRVIDDYPSIEEVTSALNAMGVSTREMMSIFQSMKRAGALQAELIIN